MAPANFQARLERIQKAHAEAPQPVQTNIRAPGPAGIAASNRVKRRRRRHPIMEHLVSTSLGIMLGCLVAVALVGLSSSDALWGPGTPLHDYVYYPTMGGLALAPVLMLVAAMTAVRKPGFALFSLGYLSGIVVPLFL
ncbi:MAG: hypothetical protein AAF999_07095 [Pseudomonadota bacterium]